MEIAIDIISTIIKLAVSNKIENDVLSQTIGILADDALKKEASAISDFINSEKAKINKILSKEHLENMHILDQHIPYVIDEMKLFLSKIQFTDELWDENQYDPEKLEEYLWKKYSSKNRLMEYEEDIKKIINDIARTLIDIKCNSRDFERNILIKIHTYVVNQNGRLQEMEVSINDIYKKIKEENEDTKQFLQILSTMLSSIKQMNPKNRTLEYAKKWDQSLFLNNYKEKDEKNGIDVKLGEVYPKDNVGFHLPRFISHSFKEPQQGLEHILDDYIINIRKGKMLLILGQSAIGKTTLITWITANYTNVINDILVYRFAADLDEIDWQKTDRIDKILKALNLSSDGLEGKTLIIDGFDEISVGQNKENVLNDIYYNCNSNKFSVIITCRENYITEPDKLSCEYIKLRPWNKEQIQSFCTIYEKKAKCAISSETQKNILCNEEVFGMPLILYMVLALNIEIKEKSSFVDVYDRIFDPEGGIYKRRINNVGYEVYPRLSKESKQIHSISMEIAFWIFENRSDKAYILKEEYEKICNKVIEGDSLDHEDVLIGNYFEQVKQKDSQGKEICKISFVHDTIYVYFVATYICSSIDQAAQKSAKELARVLGNMFKQTALSNEILDFLRIKIRNSHFYGQFELIKKAFGLMLIDGMTYYTGQCYKKAMKCEMLVFTNMLNFICLWDEEWEQSVFENDSSYIRYNEYKCCLKKARLMEIDLRGADLRGTNFEQARLEGAKLSEANLREAILRGAHLENAQLQRTNLRDADLTEAQLQETDLQDADLDNAIVDDTQIKYLDKVKNLQNIRVYLMKSEQIVSYAEYCNIPQ